MPRTARTNALSLAMARNALLAVCEMRDQAEQPWWVLVALGAKDGKPKAR